MDTKTVVYARNLYRHHERKINWYYVVVKNDALDFLKNNTLRNASTRGTIFEKIQGRVFN